MKHHPSARRLAAAVTAVLAVTAGTLAAGPAALAAAPAAAHTAAAVSDTAAAPVPYPGDAKIAGAGTTGFLTRSDDSAQELRWTRYADGTSTEVTYAQGGGIDVTGTDVLVIGDSRFPNQFRTFTLRDMGHPDAGSVHFDLGSVFPQTTATYVKAVSPNSALVRVTKADGLSELHLVVSEAGRVSERPITGLSADARDFFTSAPVIDGKVLVGYDLGVTPVPEENLPTGGRAVIDLLSGKAEKTYTSATSGYLSNPLLFSATQVGWEEGTSTGGERAVVTVDRTTGAKKTLPLGHPEETLTGLVGDWLVYGQPTALTDGWKAPLGPLRAVSRTTVGEPVELLAYATSVKPAADGTLLARGGTLDKGEGLYRIAPGADGTPTAELVATTGKPTALTYLRDEVPDVIDFSASPSVDFRWWMSRVNADVFLKVTHQKTGQTFTRMMKLSTESAGSYTIDNTIFGLTWDGVLEDFDGTRPGKPAPNGDYTWSIRATPQNGIGPVVEQSGAFKVASSPTVHDFSDNSTPDLLARNAAGELFRADTLKGRASGAPVKVGPAWNYPQIESVGNIGGTSAPDVIGVDSAGVLWVHPGTGDGAKPFGTRVKVGGGWQVYNKLAGGSDLDGDRRADLVAIDKAGDLYFYKGTGNTAAPFAPRKKIGFGWGIYNQITATGDIAGVRAGDLVARDNNGDLWLYQGRGDGTFGFRSRIGAGWNAYSQLVAVGDVTGDGRNDLYAYGPNNTSYVYGGTGVWSAPFAKRTATDILLNGGTTYNHVS
ncbi:FG-GAP repeat domain-containing protein [Streptomyces sp. NPDC004520]|uniref:FG-GAP repeat domain-containing protein n=1 Tax=Streptomyces sp. NPDC004520 TaxID=3364702 RepID=UPI0036B94CEF